MKKMVSTLLVFGLLSALSGPVLAFNDEVTVHFRTEVSQPFVQTLSQTFKAPIIAQVDKQTWRFKVPPLRTLDQYTELFASLPAVAATNPVPLYQAGDYINPQVVNIQNFPNTQPVRSQDYLPGEILVKFRPGTTADDIRFFTTNNQLVQISRISGIDVYRLRLPQNQSVPEALSLFGQNELVQYAEPNYKMSLPAPQANPNNQPVQSPQTGASPIPGQVTGNSTVLPNGTTVFTQIPLDGGGQMIVDFKPGTAKPSVALFHQIYGTREVRQESFYSYRIQLPQGLNPAKAVRIFLLYPYITNVQRLSS